MKIYIFLSFITILLTSNSTLFAAEWSAEKIVDEIWVREDTSTAYYFAVREGTWEVQSCPNAKYVLIEESNPLRKDILSLAIASKTTGAKLRFQGECTSELYFTANYVQLK